MNKSSCCYTSLSALSVIGILDFGHSNRCIVVSHCCFNLYSLDDIWCRVSFHMVIFHLYIFFSGLLPISYFENRTNRCCWIGVWEKEKRGVGLTLRFMAWAVVLRCHCWGGDDCSKNRRKAYSGITESSISEVTGCLVCEGLTQSRVQLTSLECRMGHPSLRNHFHLIHTLVVGEWTYC